MAPVSGVREQAILTQAIRSELKTQGVLGHPRVTMTALSPVWLDSRSRYLRDMYRPGMVMEQWNPETRSHDRYVIDRVTAQSHSLTLRDAQGETQVVRISSLDSSWSLFRPEKMPVADGERLRVTGKIPGLRVSGGDRLQVASVSEDAMTVVVPGRAEPASLPVGAFVRHQLRHCRAADAGCQPPAVPCGRQNGTSGACRLPAGRDSGA